MRLIPLPALAFFLALAMTPGRVCAEGAAPPVAHTCMDGWTYVNELVDDHEGIGLFYNYHQMYLTVPRDNCWMSHPASGDQPFKWLRTVTIKNGVNAGLHFEICSQGTNVGTQPCDFRLVVMANGQNLLDRTIDGQKWYEIDVDLSQFNGQTVNLELWNANGGAANWWYEIAYWSNLRFTPNGAQPQADAGKKTKSTASTRKSRPLGF